MVTEVVGKTRGPLSPPLRSAARTSAACLALVAAACQGAGGSSEPRTGTDGPPRRRSRAEPNAGAGAQSRPEPSRSGPPALIDPVRVVIRADRVTGLSDLDTDSSGRLWAIAEHTRALVRMEADGSAPTIFPVDGVPDYLDVEGLAWLDGNRLALATEANDPRRTFDVILFARVVAGRARIEGSIALDYALWPLHPLGNQGIEGLCRAGRTLVAAVETVIPPRGQRLAPVATYDLARQRWMPYLVRLTTATGKLSALSCRMRGGGVDVVAIERHFDVARLIRFEVPAPPAELDAPAAVPPPIEPVLFADLTPLLDKQENFEGLVWDGDRSIALVVDNDWVTVTGPNLLVRARLDRPGPAPPPIRRPAAPPAHPDSAQ